MQFAALQSAEVEAAMSFRGNDCDARSSVNASDSRSVNASMNRKFLVFLPHAPIGRPAPALHDLATFPGDG